MNIFKHSESDRAEFHLYCNYEWMCMRIRDFGIGKRGGNSLSTGKGVGLASMRERMAAIGGVLNIRALDGGTVVTAFTRVAGQATNGRLFDPRSNLVPHDCIRVQ